MLSKNIRTLRQKVGMSQVELAIQTGVSQGYLSHIESTGHDNISLDLGLRLAATFGVTIYQLLDPNEVPLPRRIHPALLSRVGGLNTQQQLALLRFLREVQHQGSRQAN